MPIYEYTCGGCKKDFELLVISKARPACPHCGSRKLTRRFSTFAARGASASLPCSSGQCPSATADGASCAAGRCPYSS
ncbi:MAG: zinc ribbon domain-containing protein [Phycisphaerae bacterium]